MRADSQSLSERTHIWYLRLDRFLLYLLAGELGYFVFLILAAVAVALFTAVTDFTPDFFGRYATGILWPVGPYILALPLNMLGGFASLALNIYAKHEGYPGTGHLLNWFFLMSTGWLFVLAIVFMLPSMATAY